MAMVVRSNIMAVNANRQLGMNNTQVGKSLRNCLPVSASTAQAMTLPVLQSVRK